MKSDMMRAIQKMERNAKIKKWVSPIAFGIVFIYLTSIVELDELISLLLKGF